jgi:hypothetical protein
VQDPDTTELMQYADCVGKYPNITAARALRRAELAPDSRSVNHLLAGGLSQTERGTLVAIRNLIAYARVLLLPGMSEPSPYTNVAADPLFLAGD